MQGRMFKSLAVVSAIVGCSAVTASAAVHQRAMPIAKVARQLANPHLSKARRAYLINAYGKVAYTTTGGWTHPLRKPQTAVVGIATGNCYYGGRWTYYHNAFGIKMAEFGIAQTNWCYGPANQVIVKVWGTNWLDYAFQGYCTGGNERKYTGYDPHSTIWIGSQGNWWHWMVTDTYGLDVPLTGCFDINNGSGPVRASYAWHMDTVNDWGFG